MNKQQSIVNFVLYKVLGCYLITAVFFSGIMLNFSYQGLKKSQTQEVGRAANFLIQKLNKQSDVDQKFLSLLFAQASSIGMLDDIAALEYLQDSDSPAILVHHQGFILADSFRKMSFSSASQPFQMTLYVSDMALLNAFYHQLFRYLVILSLQLALLWLLLRYLLVKLVRSSLGNIMLELDNVNLLNPSPLQGDPRLSRFFEFQKLLDGINRLAGSLAFSRRELDVLNQDLESKIKQETAKLEDKNKVLLQLNQKLSTLANTDALTQVYNRTRFDLLLREHVEITNRRQTVLTLLLIDLDDFKLVNDKFGHQVGDQVLKHAAQLLTDILGDDGVVARWGGEEFAVLLPYFDQSMAQGVAEKLRSAMQLAEFEEQQIQITMSIGVAQLLAEESGEQLLKRADAALYGAKDSGRNRVIMATKTVQPSLFLSSVVGEEKDT